MKSVSPIGNLHILVAIVIGSNFSRKGGFDEKQGQTRLNTLCQGRGYQPEGEAVRVGNWPVQFIPAFSKLTREAIREAETGDLDGLPLRVVRADYLAVIALSVGRAKDFARVLALREAGAVTDKEISELATRHGLASAWRIFLERFDES